MLSDNNFQFLRDELKQLISTHAFKYSNKNEFKLACGELSKFYFDCKRVTLRSDGQFFIGNIIYKMIKNTGIQAVGGLTLGADAMATATAYASHVQLDAIHAMIVRKQVKDHGTKRKIEGSINQIGLHVAVLDDVITTGASTIEAIIAFQEAGYIVDKAIVLIDREEVNGLQNVKNFVPEVLSIFKAKDFIS